MSWLFNGSFPLPCWPWLQVDKMVRPGSVNPSTGKAFDQAAKDERLSFFYGDM